MNEHGSRKSATGISSENRKIWTRDKCLEEAKKYSSCKEFYSECKVAYTIASKHGWLKDYIWLKRDKLPNGFWTKEMTYREAKKYSTKKEFRRNSPGAYNAACKNSWLQEYDWFHAAANEKKWNYDSCYEEARRYSSTSEFRRGSMTAYCKAKDNGWLSDYTWFVPLSDIWTFDRCFEEAKRYTYYNDFRFQSHDAFLIANRNGWIQQFDWLIKEHKEAWNRKWNYETCYEEALRYETRGQFAKHGAGAYDMARRNGWIVDYTWFPDFKDSDAKVDSVYYYLFTETKAIYIGRTLMYRQHKRDLEHRTMPNDAVYKYAQVQNCEVPDMHIIEDKLTIQEGRKREDYWRKYYTDKAYTVLNKGATGEKSSSVGMLGFGKWTRDKVIEVAKQFETVTDLCEEYEYVYKIAKAKGWLKEFTWFRGNEIRREKQIRLTKEVCTAEALKFKTRKDFRKNCRTVYEKAKKSGWLDTYTWLSFSPKIEWTYERCFEEAKKYTSKYEFQKCSYTAYSHALRNGWITDYTWFEKRFEWTYKMCRKKALIYERRSKFKKAFPGAYNKSRINGWLDDFFPKNQ